MPTPHKGESESEFVSRCIPMVIEEGTAKDQDQAIAICYSMFKQHHAKDKMPAQIINRVGSEAHIFMYGDIDENWGFSPKQLVDELKTLKSTDTVVVHINSIGGSVYDGLTIYNLLQSHPGNVVTVVEGIAASIASVIALAGKTRRIYDNAMLMIHNPLFSHLEGNADSLEEKIKLLRQVEVNIRGIYQQKTSLPETLLGQWLKDEKYISAEEAKQYGFVTEIIAPPAAENNVSFLQRLVARLQKIISPSSNLPSSSKGTEQMNFEQWLKAECEVLELDVAKLTDKQKMTLKARYDAQHGGGDPNPQNRLPPSRVPPQEDPALRMANEAAAELDRQTAINEACEDLGDVKLNADTLKALGCKGTSLKGLASHAIRNRWTVEKFELEARRATVPDMPPAIHSHNSLTEFNAQAHSCALVRMMGIPAKAQQQWSKTEYGYEKQFDQKTLEASDKLKDISLLTILDRAHRMAFGYGYQGRLNTDGFISASREALRRLRAEGNTSWTALNIFDDAMNKVLWASYQAINTTWQEFVAQMSVNDFKTANFYRMTMKGGYEQVGADGMLKHGGFTDSKYTAAANTYGKIVGLSRRDIINDDLGALRAIAAGLGEEGARFLEELFWQHLMGQLTTLFPTNDANANYISGASTDLGVDGLTLAATKFMNQVNADNAPIMMEPNLLLVGTQDAVIAAELYSQTLLQVVQSANVKGRPDQNPHVGKYRPVVSGYLNNTAIKQRINNVGTAISNQTSNQWLLVKSPSVMGGLIIGAFLNGKTTPFIEQDDAEFDVLGMQWRAYHDAGAANGDPKFGVFSKGAS